MGECESLDNERFSGPSLQAARALLELIRAGWLLDAIQAGGLTSAYSAVLTCGME